MTPRPDQSVEKAKNQKKGMEEIGSPLQDHAPFPPLALEAGTIALSTSISAQKNAEAAKLAATKEIARSKKALDDMVSRNVKYYEGEMGPFDPRNLKVGGRVRKHPVHHKGEKNADGKGGTDKKADPTNEKKASQ